MTETKGLRRVDMADVDMALPSCTRAVMTELGTLAPCKRQARYTYALPDGSKEVHVCHQCRASAAELRLWFGDQARTVVQEPTPERFARLQRERELLQLLETLNERGPAVLSLTPPPRRPPEAMVAHMASGRIWLGDVLQGMVKKVRGGYLVQWFEACSECGVKKPAIRFDGGTVCRRCRGE